MVASELAPLPSIWLRPPVIRMNHRGDKTSDVFASAMAPACDSVHRSSSRSLTPSQMPSQSGTFSPATVTSGPCGRCFFGNFGRFSHAVVRVAICSSRLGSTQTEAHCRSNATNKSGIPEIFSVFFFLSRASAFKSNNLYTLYQYVTERHIYRNKRKEKKSAAS